MADQSLKDLRVAILCATDFEQVEMTEPRKALQQAGASTTLVSPKAGEIDGMNHDQKGDKFLVDVPLDQADASSFDALMLPGGALNADFLRVDPRAQAFARHFMQRGKPVAAICHAPWLLVSAGLVRDRKMTSFHTIQDDLRNAGAQWTDQEVVVDRNLVTSRKPDDIPAFNREMISLFVRAQSAAGQRVTEPVQENAPQHR